MQILVADDESVILRAVGRTLEKAGHKVVEAPDAAAALRAIVANHFDVILSDILMPGLSGLDLLREVRKSDLDVPVILMTGSPEIDSAIEAIDLGAFRYLKKPYEPDELVSCVTRAGQMHQLALAKRQALEIAGHDEHLLGDRASLENRFASALSGLYMAFQPLVSLHAKRPVAFEALLRTEEPTLRNPLAFVTAAEKLDRVHQLGRRVRAAIAAAVTSAPDDVDIFVNLHPADLLDVDLSDRQAALTKIASRVVLEITERASLEDIDDVAVRVERLRAIGFRVAVDDLGAGYAGLTSLTTLEPDVVKLDMSLVRGIDQDDRRQRVVASLTELCQSLKMKVVIEGVETRGERDTVQRLGADILQGYLFAKPARGFPSVSEEFFS